MRSCRALLVAIVALGVPGSDQQISAVFGGGEADGAETFIVEAEIDGEEEAEIEGVVEQLTSQ